MPNFDAAGVMPAHLPYPASPNYRCGAFGDWTLNFKAAETVERGYFTGLDVEPSGHYLEHGGDIWMSTSRLERESHAVHLGHARGTVVVCGVGMGMYLYNVTAKPEVERVIAVDRDAAVIQLVRSATGFGDWVGHNKVTFLHKDALALTPGDLGDARADYLYVDIWPELGNPNAVAQTRAIQDVVKARSVGWWGQELDFIEWAFHNRPQGHVVSVDDLRAFTEACGLAIGERSAAYVQGCRAAAAVYATYGSLSFAVQARERLSAGVP